MIGCERFFCYRELSDCHNCHNCHIAQNGTLVVISRCAISHIGCELYSSALVIYITHLPHNLCRGDSHLLKSKNKLYY